MSKLLESVIEMLTQSWLVYCPRNVNIIALDLASVVLHSILSYMGLDKLAKADTKSSAGY